MSSSRVARNSTGVFDLLTFASRLRQEGPNAAWFLSMADARQRLEDWRIDYNDHRPHSTLGDLMPSAFAALPKPARKVA